MRNKITIVLLVALLFPALGKAQGDDAKQQRKFDYFFYEGLNLRDEGKYDAAFDLFNHCLEMDSTSSALLFELSSFYLQLNQPQKAVGMLRRAVRYAGNNITYKMALATISRSLGLYDEAAAVYQDLVREYPKKEELNYYLADAYTQAGKFQQAIAAYNALESAMGVNEAISMQKFKLYNDEDKPDSALLEIKKLEEKFPAEARYPILLGDSYLENGDTAKALKAYKQAHAIDPANPLYIVAMANYYDARHDSTAARQELHVALTNPALGVDDKISILSRYLLRLQQNKQSPQTTVPLFKTLIEQYPENNPLHLMYGRLLLAGGKAADAKAQFQLVTETEPGNADAWQQLLDLAIRAQDAKEIVRICERCVELFPTAPEYYFYLSIGYYQLNEYAKALGACEKGVKEVPDDNTALLSTYYSQMGDINHELKNDSAAFANYDKALQYNPDNVLTLNNYAYFLALKNKDLKRAERMSARCIKLEPDNATYLDTYAWIFFMEGNYSLAKFYIENALSKDDTNSPELVEHYGDILFKSGNKEKAIEEWKKAKAMGKKSEVLDKKIAKGIYIEDENAD
ncbi:MAG: tetratricopeptide repeat protein [Tannerella sp.]|jgi:tetratricopeptide (TPR) repeat protein|nr:tetratricopeptide repeat protein [Tannerella sp.]